MPTLKVGVGEGNELVLSNNGYGDCGLTRMYIAIFLVSLWKDLAKGQESI